MTLDALPTADFIVSAYRQGIAPEYLAAAA